MKPKTILFFSIEVGIAHITRSLAIAEELQRAGHNVYFVVNKRKRALIEKSKIKTIDVSIFGDNNFLDTMDKYKDPAYLMPFVKEEIKIIERYKADIIVIDFRFPTVAAASVLDIPTYFIVGSGGLPHGCHIPSLSLPKPLYTIFSKLVLWKLWSYKVEFYNAINSCVQSLGVQSSTNQLINRMKFIVPEAQGYLPANKNSNIIHYAGDFAWKGFDDQIPSWLDTIDPDGRTIYISFGGTGYDAEKLIHLSTAFVKRGFRVIVSASSIARVEDFPTMENLFVVEYISGNEVCKRVDVIVCHGGYGTMIQAIKAGKPVVANPFNPDQVIHSLRFQELGVAESTISFDLKWLSLNWRDFLNIGKKTTIDTIIHKVERVLKNKDNYKTAIKRFQDNYIVHGDNERGAAKFITTDIKHES